MCTLDMCVKCVRDVCVCVCVCEMSGMRGTSDRFGPCHLYDRLSPWQSLGTLDGKQPVSTDGHNGNIILSLVLESHIFNL